MAFDEVIRQQLTLLNGLMISAATRWVQAANRARDSSYTIEDYFQDVRGQFVESWDILNAVMDQPAVNMVPTATIRGSHSKGMVRAFDDVRVRQRLTYASLRTTPLYRFGGNATIPESSYDVTVIGAFEGMVHVEINTNPTTAPTGPLPDVYRGTILARLPGEQNFGPLAFVVVVVEP